jgi:hypothetical protein
MSGPNAIIVAIVKEKSILSQIDRLCHPLHISNFPTKSMPDKAGKRYMEMIHNWMMPKTDLWKLMSSLKADSTLLWAQICKLYRSSI